MGTFTRSLFTMFELTLANWPTVTRNLAENVNEVWMLVGLTHKLVIGFAVIGVVNGVFMQETFKVAAEDDTIMMQRTNKAGKRLRAKMHRLFQSIDQDGSG